VRSISGVRKKVHRRYLIFFRIEAGEVQILRIVHGSRDWAALVRAM
jgi:plasmid stabilization system protein ParE